TYLIQWEADNTRLFGDRLQDGLTDPPYGIGNEFKTFGLIKTFGRFDQSEIPLVNQIAQREPLVLVLLGHGDDKTKVRLRQPLQSGLVALPDFLCEDDLLFGCNQVYFTNLMQVFV